MRVASNVESRIQEEERKEGGIVLIDELPAHFGAAWQWNWQEGRSQRDESFDAPRTRRTSHDFVLRYPEALALYRGFLKA